jgi:hypothetical protein
MDSNEVQRQHIERAIARARDGVSDRINELDSRVRSDYNPVKLASDHAPKIIAAGLGLGLLVGFGMPRALRRLIAIGVPLALVAMKVRNAIADGAHEPAQVEPAAAAVDYPI